MLAKPLRVFLFWLAALVLGSVAGTAVKMYPTNLLVALLYIYFFVLDSGLIYAYLWTLRSSGLRIRWIREGLIVGIIWFVLLFLEIVVLDVMVLGFDVSLVWRTWPSYIIVTVAGLVAGLIADARYGSSAV